MRLRYLVGILSLTLSSYALASGEKGKEEMVFPVTKPSAVMAEVRGDVVPQALEEDLEAAQLFLELSRSPDPELQKEYREHLKSSLGRLEEHRNALRSSLSSSGDMKAQVMEKAVGATISQINATLQPSELPTRIFGMPIESFRARIEASYRERMKQLEEELAFYSDTGPVVVVSQRAEMRKCVVLLKMFEVRLNYFSAHRKYLGEQRSIYELMCPNAQEDASTALIMQQVLSQILRYQPVKGPDCLMVDYEYHQCRALFKMVRELFEMPVDYENLDQQARSSVVTINSDTAKPIVMKTSLTREELLSFKERADVSRALAHKLLNEPMGEAFMAVYLDDLENVFSQMQADPFFIKNKQQADSVQANPSKHDRATVIACEQILGYERLMREAIAKTKQKLGRK